MTTKAELKERQRRQHAAAQVTCPVCAAEPFRACKGPRGAAIHHHVERIDLGLSTFPVHSSKTDPT